MIAPINPTPTDQSQPPWHGRCGRRLKSCRKCKYRFTAGDKRWDCPECGADRHCCSEPTAGIVGGACRLHGGRSLKGPASGTYRTGSFSKFLPPDLAVKFEEMNADENLLRLRDEAALLRVRETELMERLGTGESEGGWQRLIELWADLQAAMSASDAASMQSILAAIGRTINANVNRNAAWKDLRGLAKDRAAIVKAEAEINERMQYVVAVEQVQMLFDAVARIVLETVEDKKICSLIAAKLAALQGPRLPAPIVSAGVEG